jgi:hypothetical protein
LLAQINAADNTLNVNAFLNINPAMPLDAFYRQLSSVNVVPGLASGNKFLSNEPNA